MELNRTRIAVAVATILLITGCTAKPGPGSTPEPAAETAASAEAPSALELVGLWRVAEAEPFDEPVWFAFHPTWFTVWTENCWSAGGVWVADGASVSASVASGSGDCAYEIFTSVYEWFPTIHSFERTSSADGGGWRLLDASGATVAQLTAETRPDAISVDESDLLAPLVPVVDAEARAHFHADPAPLPEPLTPADADILEGRWNLVDYEGAGDPHVTFEDGRNYGASDGCNIMPSPMLIGAEGRFRGAMTGSTQIGCDNVDLPKWTAETARIGVDGETRELVLLDASGMELARLIRPGTAPTSRG